METQPQQQVTPILEVAWMRFAQLDAMAFERSKAHIRLRKWITALGILTTLFAILTQLFAKGLETTAPLLGWILKFFLILTPIGTSVLAAYVSQFYSSGDWLVTRAGAEEILKEIYAYRTILQKSPNRRKWLEKRLAEIQRSVFRGMNGEFIIKPYKGVLPPPPRFSPKYPNSDPGFDDITGDEYFRYRLEDQLNWHVKEINKRQKERTRLKIYILVAGGMGALFAALGDPLTLWTALAAAFAAAFIGWQELRALDSVVRNYSKVIMELNIINDHWKNLDTEEKNQTEFFKTVQSTEDILWSQNVEYIKAMQEALKDSDLEEEASLINRVIKEQRESDKRFKQGIEDAVVDLTQESMVKSEEALTETFKETLGTLAEEASSDLVQAELAAMAAAVREAVEEAAENISERIGGMSAAMKALQDEFEGVEISSSTPMSVLNDLLSRYPKTVDPKG
ncbi:MAG: SLATT domain-containing protein [Chloroflexi bacterium]|nr:SLATT domain-containing protein [Chloroflexota bacterium]